MAEENLKRTAVIVGINEYKDTKINKLKGAERDAEELCTILRENGDFDIPDKYKLIGEEATCEAIRKAISDVFYHADRCALTFFYFSGHGRELDFYNEGYICPYDMDFDNPIVYGIKMSELQQVVSNSVGPAQADSAVAILDCCYSGIATKDKGDITADLISVLDSGFKNVKGGKGFYMLASSGENEKSREVTNLPHKGEVTAHPHGAFTFHLLEGLAGEAAQGEETIFLGPLYQYAYEKLKGTSQEPKKCCREATGMFTIPIAKNLKIIDTRIQEKFRKADENYDEDDPITIFYAIPLIDYVLRYNKKHQEAIELKKKINADLQQYRESGIWLCAHLVEIKTEIKYAFKKLEPFIEKKKFPDFDKIARLDDNTQRLLANLCEAAKNNVSPEYFVSICKPFNKPDKVTSNARLGKVEIAKRPTPTKT